MSFLFPSVSTPVSFNVSTPVIMPSRFFFFNARSLFSSFAPCPPFHGIAVLCEPNERCVLFCAHGRLQKRRRRLASAMMTDMHLLVGHISSGEGAVQGSVSVTSGLIMGRYEAVNNTPVTNENTSAWIVCAPSSITIHAGNCYSIKCSEGIICCRSCLFIKTKQKTLTCH